MTDTGMGRRPNTPDDRDWTWRKIHTFLQANRPRPTDDLLDKTFREAIDEGNPFLTTWKGILALWAWIKEQMKKPKPTPTPTPTPTTVDGPLWEIATEPFDQGAYGTCVGNAWAGWGNAMPIQDAYTEKDARDIYYESTVIGGHPDDPDSPGGGQEGSTTRDGAKAMQQRGKLTAYAFAAKMDEVNEWLDNHGPVVIGINWTEDMFDPDADGTVHYTGAIAGGHEVVVIQNLNTEGKKLCRNSWGPDWGLNGNFKITNEDFVSLMTQDGDACLALEV